MRHAIGHIPTESEYLRRVDAELIQDAQRRDASLERRRHLAAACQVNDPKILDQLEKLGFNEVTVSLLCLVPLVQVAWADWISQTERERVLAAAAEHGVQQDTPAYQALAQWLEAAGRTV